MDKLTAALPVIILGVVVFLFFWFFWYIFIFYPYVAKDCESKEQVYYLYINGCSPAGYQPKK
jgi:hypothetical protein